MKNTYYDRYSMNSSVIVDSAMGRNVFLHYVSQKFPPLNSRNSVKF